MTICIGQKINKLRKKWDWFEINVLEASFDDLNVIFKPQHLVAFKGDFNNYQAYLKI